jgi:ABC-type uncharacterized transport system involved in gliding motility auxiliary subunit
MSRPALLLGVQIALVVAIFGCVLAVVARHPGRLDLTPDRRFTLSPHTREVLGRLRDDVKITLFYSSQEGALRREMADLLALYEDAAPRVAVRLLDLDRTPGAAERLGVHAYNVAVVEAGERRERIDPVTEETVTAALLAVAGTAPVATYFVLGHGERDPRDTDERGGASEAARALAADSFLVRVLEGTARIPDDAGLVLLGGPVRDLAPAEVEALAAHVGRGGRLLVLCGQEAPGSVRALLARFGVELGGDVVVDEQGRLFGTDGLSARVAYLNQTLVPTTPEANALLPLAQSLRVLDVPGLRGEYLAMTAETTWADVGRRSLRGPAAFEPGTDRRGPLPVAALVRVPVRDGVEGRVAVVGDADFASNLQVNVLGNRDLLLAAAELVARADPLAAARPPAPPGGTFSPLALTAREARLVFWGAVVSPAALLTAIALTQARRRRWA